MSVVDTINAVMGLGASGFLWYNVYTLYVAKSFKGVSWGSVAYFTVLGFWYLFFYFTLHQWLSLFAGISGVVANIVWLALAVKYCRKNPCCLSH